MANVEIKFDKDQLERIQKMFRDMPKIVTRIIPDAINKTAAPAKTEISRAVRADVALKARTVNQALKLTRARPTRWQADINVSPVRIPLGGFTGIRQNKKGVTYVIEKAQGRKTAEHAFKATMPSLHKGVFKRKGKSRLPITELKGPSIGALYNNLPGLAAEIMEFCYTNLELNIDRQIQRHLKARAR